MRSAADKPSTAAASPAHQPGRSSLFDPGDLFTFHARERRVLPLLARCGFGVLRDARILEVGCGNGLWLRDFVRWGAQPDHLTGVDLHADRIASARRLCPEGVTLTCADATALDFADHAFDIVLQSTVFTSIGSEKARLAVAAEMTRLVRPRGLILWYDYHIHYPGHNRSTRGITRRDIDRLFPSCQIDLRRVTLAPPIARAIAPHSWIACELLELLPLLRTHYLGVIRPNRS